MESKGKGAREGGDDADWGLREEGREASLSLSFESSQVLEKSLRLPLRAHDLPFKAGVME